MEESLIGLCGMNCGICSGYLAEKNDLMNKGIKVRYCAGCRSKKNNFCAFVKKCELLAKKLVTYCYECGNFPCEKLTSLDKRYRQHYHMSEIDNLKHIKENGMKKFLEREEGKWKCPECSGVICCHDGICYTCGLEELKAIDKFHRWTNERSLADD